MMFGQTFAYSDLLTILILMVLESVMSIDNALVLGLLVQRVEPSRRAKALSYGLMGALLLRIVAIMLAAFLLKVSVVKLLGGLYLVYVGVKYFLTREKSDTPDETAPVTNGFWTTVFWIELTDLAFAVDSILAAVALVGSAPASAGRSVFHPKLWVIVVGGMLGVIAIRFAASVVSKLLGRFPKLNRSAYLLVMLIGMKLVLDYAVNTRAHPDRLDFGNLHSPAFWVFWALMALCLAAGLI